MEKIFEMLRRNPVCRIGAEYRRLCREITLCSNDVAQLFCMRGSEEREKEVINGQR